MFAMPTTDARRVPRSDKRSDERHSAPLEGAARASGGIHRELLADEVRSVPRGRDNHGDLSSAVAEIDERIAAIEAELASVAPLVAERERLLRARAALLGAGKLSELKTKKKKNR
jgi:hypothetical protein